MSASDRSLLVAEDLGAIKAEMRAMAARIVEMEDECKERDSKLDQRVSSLEKWQRVCSGIASGWGGIILAVSAICAMAATYWEHIVAFIMRQKP